MWNVVVEKLSGIAAGAEQLVHAFLQNANLGDCPFVCRSQDRLEGFPLGVLTELDERAMPDHVAANRWPLSPQEVGQSQLRKISTREHDVTDAGLHQQGRELVELVVREIVGMAVGRLGEMDDVVEETPGRGSDAEPRRGMHGDGVVSYCHLEHVLGADPSIQPGHHECPEHRRFYAGRARPFHVLQARWRHAIQSFSVSSHSCR